MTIFSSFKIFLVLSISKTLWLKVWLLVIVIAYDVLVQMRSTLLPGQPWDVMVDLFFYREPEETKEPGEEDAADYSGDQGYNALPAPGGKLPSCFCLLLCTARQCCSSAI